MAGAVVALRDHSELGYLLALLGFLAGLAGLAITAIEMVAGYRGSPQMIAVVLAGVTFLLPLLFYLALISSGAGN